MLFTIFLQGAFASAVLAIARTSAPSGAIIVSKSASGSGQYNTIQAAVDSLSKTSIIAQSIFIDQGTYAEQVYIPTIRSALTIYGYTTDTSNYGNNKVIITHKASLATGAANDDMTATLRVWTPNFKMYNVNVYNTNGRLAQNGQALAISAQKDLQGYYGVGMFSYQDTLLSNAGRQVFGKCYIEGAVDFIFGQDATALIDSSDLRINGPGSITASGRASSSNPSIYLISKSSIAASQGSTAQPGQAYLGRPWGNYARVVFQNTIMSDIINPAGWDVWQKTNPQTAHAVFEEYGNTGAGSSGARASFSKKIAAPISINSVLGSDYKNWVDTSYLSAAITTQDDGATSTLDTGDN